jgi:hypothetical protein
VRLCRVIFETRRTKAQQTRRVKDNWACWRLIFSDIGNFTYEQVFYRMTPQQINEANVALDIAAKARANAAKKGR